MALHEVREATGRSQSSLAATLGISQPAVSQVEGGSDLKISTLRAYLEALGARLEIVAVFGEADDEVAVPVDLNHRSSSGQGRALR
jgi:transcriptional regulator with XRE-family HTH domain